MKHISLISKQDADPASRKLWESMGDFDLALFHLTAHAPSSMEGWMRFGGTIWDEQEGGMPMLLKEMAVVQTSVLSNSSYEWGNHGANMIRRGATQEQLDALVIGQPDSEVFNDTEKLVLKFTTEMTIDARPTEETLTALSEQFTARRRLQSSCSASAAT